MNLRCQTLSYRTCMMSWKIPATILLSLAPACGALLAAPSPGGDPRIAGHWVLDQVASDDFDRKLAQLMEQRQRQFRPMRRPVQGEVPPLPEPAFDTPERVRLQLRETLKPASDLRIALDDSSLEILADQEPLRRFMLGQPVTRLDASGAAEVIATWSGSTLQIRARYSHRGLRTHQFTLDHAGALLRTTLVFNDPMSGKLELHSVYKRSD